MMQAMEGRAFRDQCLKRLRSDHERGASQLARMALGYLAEATRDESLDEVGALRAELDSFAKELQAARPSMVPIERLVALWRAEAAGRQAAGVPPYGRMAGIILSGPDERVVFDLGRALAQAQGPLKRIKAQLFGPAAAPVARIRGRHRVRLLVQAPKAAPIQAALAAWRAQIKVPNNVRLTIDIDPQTFF
jgi:primosomal protein N' (replication factor Y)